MNIRNEAIIKLREHGLNDFSIETYLEIASHVSFSDIVKMDEHDLDESINSHLHPEAWYGKQSGGIRQ